MKAIMIISGRGLPVPVLQGWAAYLGGMCGYGYGSQKIWSANEAPGVWAGAVKKKVSNGYDKLTKKEMTEITWMESLQLPAAKQLGYMKGFLCEVGVVETHSYSR